MIGRFQSVPTTRRYVGTMFWVSRYVFQKFTSWTTFLVLVSTPAGTRCTFTPTLGCHVWSALLAVNSIEVGSSLSGMVCRLSTCEAHTRKLGPIRSTTHCSARRRPAKGGKISPKQRVRRVCISNQASRRTPRHTVSKLILVAALIARRRIEVDVADSKLNQPLSSAFIIFTPHTMLTLGVRLRAEPETCSSKAMGRSATLQCDEVVSTPHWVVSK